MKLNGFYQLYMLLRHPCKAGPEAIKRYGTPCGSFFVYICIFILSTLGSILFDSAMMDPMDSLGLAYPFLNTAQHRIIIALMDIIVMVLQIAVFGWIVNAITYRFQQCHHYALVVTTLTYLAAYKMVVDFCVGMVLLMAAYICDSTSWLSFLLAIVSTTWCLIVAVYTMARQMELSYVDTFSNLLMSAIVFVACLIIFNIIVFVV